MTRDADPRTGPPDRRMEQEHFDLLKAKMDARLTDMRRALNAEMFRDDGRPSAPVTPMRWWTRWGWAVRGYLATLWLALKGVDPYDPGDDY